MSRESLVVGYLSGGHTTHAFTHCYAAATAYMMSRAHEPDYPLLLGSLPLQSGPRIAAARNSLVRRFLMTGGDWLLMLDDDMSFDPDAWDRMLQSAHPTERPIIGGLCIGGGRDGWFPTLYQLSQERETMMRLDMWPGDELVPVDATGAACLLIHRTVLEKLAAEYDEPWPWFQETTYRHQDVGEDHTFCLRARAAGFPIYINTGVEFGHVKLVTVDLDYYRKWVKANRFVVTGTGRCGTEYMAHLFSALGIAVRHEEVYTPTSAEWEGWERGDSSWLAAPHLGGFDGHVVHVVRDPLAVINSLVGIKFFDEEAEWQEHQEPYQDYARRFVPLVFEPDDPLERAIRFYVLWSDMIDPHTDTLVQVEHIDPEAIAGVCRAAGAFHSAHDVQAKLPTIATDINTRFRATLTWGDLPEDNWTKRLRQKAKAYGYVAGTD